MSLHQVSVDGTSPLTEDEILTLRAEVKMLRNEMSELKNAVRDFTHLTAHEWGHTKAWKKVAALVFWEDIPEESPIRPEPPTKAGS